ncbi:hypothetical protein MASR1M90_06670 [Desulfovibrionales bacterium]
MALALDEQKDTDTVHDVDGYTFLVETNLMQEAKSISVEFHPHTGFNVLSALKNTSSGCSSCTSCG